MNATRTTIVAGVAGLLVIAGSAGAGLTAVVAGDPVDLDTASTTAVGNIAVVCNAAESEYLVAWNDDRATGADEDYSIYAQRVAADGTKVGENLAITTALGGWQYRPTLACNIAANEYFVTWIDRTGSPSDPGYGHTYGQRMSTTGVPLSGVVDLLSGGFEPTIAYNFVDDEYLISARRFDTDQPSAIIAGRVAASATPIAPELVLADEPFAHAPAGQVAYGAGVYLATWRQQQLGQVLGQRIAADGTLLGGYIVIDDVLPTSGFATGNAFDPVNGRFLVVYGQAYGGPLRGQFVRPDGTLDGSPIIVRTGPTPETDLVPAIAYNAESGMFLVAWLEIVPTLTDVEQDVLAQAVRADGSLAGRPVHIATDPFQRPRVAANATDGGFLVTWVDEGAEDGRDAMARLVQIDCPADNDGNGTVGFADLIELLDQWGPCPGCRLDINGDGSIGFFDLTRLLSSWGPCV